MRRNPFETKYDVCVIGAGFSGVAVALTAAKAGRRVLLVEWRPQIGWEATSAYHLDIGQVQGEVIGRIISRSLHMDGVRNGYTDGPITEFVLDELLTEAGVDVLLYCRATRVLTHDGLATGVVLGNKSGEQIVQGRLIVDATEEGFLWKQTGVAFSPAVPQRGRQTVFFNGSKAPLDEPQVIGDAGDAMNVTVKPMRWPSEVCVEFDLPECSVIAGRCAMPDVINLVRQRVPFLRDALVTHSGYEPYPLDVPHLEKTATVHPTIRNLFGAGVWTIPDTRERLLMNTLSGRASLGEHVGNLVVQARLPEPPAPSAAGSVLTPPYRECDVLVAGGGTAGPLAAIAAARQGVKVTLIEASPLLGGIGTGGGIHIYYHGVVGGLQDEVDRRVEELTPLFSGKYKVVGFHPEVKKFVLLQMCREAGVNVVFNTFATGVEFQEHSPSTSNVSTSRQVGPVGQPLRRLTGVVTAGPEGAVVYRAKTFVDSTGDADIAALASVPFTLGRQSDELPHAYTLSCGRLDRAGNLVCTNFDAGYVDPTDVTDITRARRVAMNHYRRDRFTPEDRLLYIAPILGLRQSRQIIGDYQLTLSDEIFGRQFPDTIAYAQAHYDNHGFDYENESDEAVLWVWLLGNWRRQIGCEIPYRCLLPRNVEGLLVACRAISITIDAHYQLRMQRDMQRIGEAAGIAAAMAAKLNITPRQIDVGRLQAELRRVGALDESKRPKPSLPEPPVPILKEQLTPDAVWPLLQSGSQSLPVVRDAVHSNVPAVRFWASVVLAMQRDKAAVPELIACVRERRAEVTTTAPKAAPHWMGAIVMLGRVGDPAAVPVLAEVLQDRTASMDAIIAAVRALGRIGDRAAVPAIEQMLERTDINTTRVLQISTGAVSKPVCEDATWQLRLAAAEALAKLGKPRPDIVKPFLDDERAYVRRYAARVMEMCK